MLCSQATEKLDLLNFITLAQDDVERRPVWHNEESMTHSVPNLIGSSQNTPFYLTT